MTKRRPAKEAAELTPTHESDASNKYTFCAGTENEFTILLRVPVGRENRKKTAKLMPFMKHMKHFVSPDGSVDTRDLMAFFDVIEEIWDQEVFDEEHFPFAVGLDPSDPRLEKVGVMDAFIAFIKAMSVIMGSFSGEEVELAEKKSEG
jgi:hypothetical protein